MTLTWKVTQWETGPIDPNDGLAYDGELVVGRVHRIDHPPQQGQWRWSMTAHVKRPAEIEPTHGFAPTKDEAKAKVAECYERAKAQGVVRSA